MVRVTSLGCIGSILPLVASLAVVVSVERLRRPLSGTAIEVAVTLVMITGMMVATLGTPGMICKMHGEACSEYVYDGLKADSGLLLTIDGIVTAAHLGLPVRWCVIVLLEIVSVLTYASIVFLIGSLEPTFNACFNLLFLTGLVVATATGKRFAEIKDRQSFLDLIKARTLQCEAEFKLSQAGDQQNSHVGLASNKSSSVFDASDHGASLADKLSRVKACAKEEHWNIEAEQVRLLRGQVLGRGGFGTVVRAVLGGIVVAVKLANKQLEGDTSAESLWDLCNELRTFRHVRHPNIVSFHGAIIDTVHCRIAVVLEYVRGTILNTFMAAREGVGSDNGPSTVQRYQILLGVCSALVHLHNRQPHIVHSDLKSTNIVVQVFCGDAHPKLLDFGLSRVLTRGRQLVGGTLTWMAPEARSSRALAKCSGDMYAFGLLVAFVAADLRPRSARHQGRRAAAQPALAPWPPGCALEPGCKPLAEACLQPDEGARPSATEAQRLLLVLPEALGLAAGGGSSGFFEDVLSVAEAAVQQPSAAAALWESESEEGAAASAPLRSSAPAPPLGEPPAGPRPPAQAWKPVPGPCTTRETLRETLLALLSRWNFEKRRPPCCELHAAARLAVEINEELLAMPCIQQPLPHGEGQCPRCGILDLPASGCDLCYGSEDTAPMAERPGSDRLAL